MNWKEINEKCPKAFLEWVSSKVGYDVATVKYCEEKEVCQQDDEHCFELPNSDFLWVASEDAVYFPCYFDTLGIILNISDIDEAAKVLRDFVGGFDSSGKFYYTLKHGIHEDSKESFPDRLSATIAGVTKAFEIREQQLNELKAMIPREILQQALADYEKAVEAIKGMKSTEAVGYLWENQMQFGLCHYLEAIFDVDRDYSSDAFGDDYLGGWRVCRGKRNSIHTLTARLQLRINKLKELINDNPLPLPK